MEGRDLSQVMSLRTGLTQETCSCCSISHEEDRRFFVDNCAFSQDGTVGKQLCKMSGSFRVKCPPVVVAAQQID